MIDDADQEKEKARELLQLLAIKNAEAAKKITDGGDAVLQKWCAQLGIEWEGFTCDEVSEAFELGIDELEFKTMIREA